MAIRNGVTVRGTSNKNKNGSAEARRRRKVWLIETYRANVDLTVPKPGVLEEIERTGRRLNLREDTMKVPACRCYRCGVLLWFDTVTVDRIVPGCVKTKKYPNGGTYVRENIRPACSPCNELHGGQLRSDSAKEVVRRRHR